MDIGFFFRRRIAFIQQLYITATHPYSDRKQQIEVGEEPFVPPYSEDGEPPFLEEWLEADESQQLIGYACISMLAAALKLYFQSWQQVLGVPVDGSLKPVFRDKGFLAGYQAYFRNHFGIRFEECPIDLKRLEEIVVAAGANMYEFGRFEIAQGFSAVVPRLRALL